MSDPIIDPAHQSRDMALVRRAVKQGWDIPVDTMAELPKLMLNIAKDGAEKATDRIAATKVLVVMQNQNEKRQAKPRKKQPHQQTIVLMEGNIDDVKRQLMDRANQLCIDSGGVGADPAGHGDATG